MASDFKKYMYGVGLEFDAKSFKGVKDEFKVNLDSLEKLIKSYDKILKIDPDVDLSTLFKEIQKIKAMTDGMSKSGNAMEGFVDKGVLERIASVEHALDSLSNQSKQVQKNLNGMLSMFNELKSAGEFKIPGTFDNLFGGAKDQSENIQKAQNNLDELNKLDTKLDQVVDNINKNTKAKKPKNDDVVFDLISEFDDLLSLDDTKILESIKDIENIGTKLNSAIQGLSSEQKKSFNVDDNYVVNELDGLFVRIGEQRKKITEELQGLNEEQKLYQAKQTSRISSGGKSLGLASGTTMQVKVDPKVNEGEWVSKINAVIGNVSAKLQPIELKPTLLKQSKNVKQTTEDALEKIDHTVNIEIEVKDNIEAFNEKIKEVDNTIKEAKESIQKQGNFKINLEFENKSEILSEADKIRKDISNKFKNIEINLVPGEQGSSVIDTNPEDINDNSIQIATEDLSNFSKKAQNAYEEVKKINQQLEDLETNKFKSDTFLKLGKRDVNGKYIKGSKKELKNQISEYDSSVDSGDSKKAIQLEEELNKQVQKQIEYLKVKKELQKQIYVDEVKKSNPKQDTSEIIDINAIRSQVTKAKKELESYEEAIKSLEGKIGKGEQGWRSPYMYSLTEDTKKILNTNDVKKSVDELNQKYSDLNKKAKELESTKGIDSTEYQKVNEELEETKNLLTSVWNTQKNFFNTQKNQTQEFISKNEDLLAIQDSIDKINTLENKLADLKSAKEKLSSTKDYSIAAETGLGNVNDRKYKDGTIKEIDKLIAENTSASKASLKTIHQDQIKYCDTEIAKIEEEIQKEKELLKIRQQQSNVEQKIANKQKTDKTSANDTSKEKSAATSTSTSTKTVPVQEPTTVKLDDSALSALAKEQTVKEINGKVGNIESQFNGGLNIKGSEINITAGKVQVNGDIDESKTTKNKKTQGKVDAEESSTDKKSKEDANFDNATVSMNYPDVNVSGSSDWNFEGQSDSNKSNYSRTDRRAQRDPSDRITLQSGTYDEFGILRSADMTFKTQDNLKTYTDHYRRDENGILKYIGETYTNNLDKKFQPLIKSIENVKQKYTELNRLMNEAPSSVSDQMYSKLKEYERLMSALQTERQAIENNPRRLKDEGYRDQFDSILYQLERVKKEFLELQNSDIDISKLNKFITQFTVYEEQIKRSGQYTDELRLKFETLRDQLNNTRTVGDAELFKFDFDDLKAEISEMKTYNKLYDDLVNSRTKQINLGREIKHSDSSTNKAEVELKAEQEISRNLEKQLSSYTNMYGKQANLTAWAEARAKAEQLTAKSVAEQVDKQNNAIYKVVDTAQNKYNTMSTSASESVVPMSGVALEKLKQYETLLIKLKQMQKEVANNPKLMSDQNYSNNFNSLLSQMQKIETEFNSLQKASVNFFSKIKSESDIKVLDESFDPNNLTAMHASMREFANQVGSGEVELIRFNDAQNTATFSIKNGKNEIQKLEVAYDSATNSLGGYVTETRTLQTASQRFNQVIKQGFAHFGQYIASFGGMYELFAQVRRGFSYVLEIDKALTELKKVTDATDETYTQFLSHMSEVGSVVGSTTAELVNSAADWARLNI